MEKFVTLLDTNNLNECKFLKLFTAMARCVKFESQIFCFTFNHFAFLSKFTFWFPSKSFVSLPRFIFSFHSKIFCFLLKFLFWFFSKIFIFLQRLVSLVSFWNFYFGFFLKFYFSFVLKFLVSFQNLHFGFLPKFLISFWNFYFVFFLKCSSWKVEQLMWVKPALFEF